MSAAASFICRAARRRSCGAHRLVISGREALLNRLAAVARKLDGTKFGFREHNDHVEATCPWGNRVRCYEPDAARFGRISLGIPMSNSTYRSGPLPASRHSYPPIMGHPRS
jgi:hypothetical protein